MKRFYFLFLAVLLSAPVMAQAKPVKHIPVYVEPYYNAAQTLEGTPEVAVGPAFDELLRSHNPKDILAVSEKIKAEPDFVTPMTMMVLAVRLYDTSQRDDAVFWFYAARDRYTTVNDVIDVETAQMAEVDAAMGSFMTLIGPFINSYAFCDIDKRNKLRMAAFEWVTAHPYMTLYSPTLKKRLENADIKHEISESLRRLDFDISQERAYLLEEGLEELKTQRRDNKVDEQYCWK